MYATDSGGGVHTSSPSQSLFPRPPFRSSDMCTYEWSLSMLRCQANLLTQYMQTCPTYMMLSTCTIVHTTTLQALAEQHNCTYSFSTGHRRAVEAPPRAHGEAACSTGNKTCDVPSMLPYHFIIGRLCI